MVELLYDNWITKKRWLLPVTGAVIFVIFLFFFRGNYIVGRSLCFFLLLLPFLTAAYFYRYQGMLEFIGVILLIAGAFLFLDFRMNGKEAFFFKECLPDYLSFSPHPCFYRILPVRTFLCAS